MISIIEKVECFNADPGPGTLNIFNFVLSSDKKMIRNGVQTGRRVTTQREEALSSDRLDERDMTRYCDDILSV